MPYNKDQMVIYVTERRRYFKKSLIDGMGGKCCVCNYNRCQDVLCLHHINPKEKKFSFNKMVSKSMKDMIKEAKKCILLCNNCHTEFHAGFITLPNKMKRLSDDFEFPKFILTEEARRKIKERKQDGKDERFV